MIKTLNGHTNVVFSLTVLQNGNLVSGSVDNTIKIWNQTTGALIQTLAGHTDGVDALTVLQNGNLVCGSRDNKIKDMESNNWSINSNSYWSYRLGQSISCSSEW